MARQARSEADDSPPTSGAWTPPTGAQQVELAEFYKFATKGEVVIGRINRITERPDPMHADKIMRGLVLSPVVVINTKGERQAYRTLAIGLSAHLGLLIGRPEKEIGSSYAFVYDGTRPSDTKGKQPSHQFNVYKLSESDFAGEIRKTDPENAELLLSLEGEKQAPLPF